MCRSIRSITRKINDDKYEESHFRQSQTPLRMNNHSQPKTTFPLNEQSTQSSFYLDPINSRSRPLGGEEVYCGRPLPSDTAFFFFFCGRRGKITRTGECAARDPRRTPPEYCSRRGGDWIHAGASARLTEQRRLAWIAMAFALSVTARFWWSAFVDGFRNDPIFCWVGWQGSAHFFGAIIPNHVGFYTSKLVLWIGISFHVLLSLSKCMHYLLFKIDDQGNPEDFIRSYMVFVSICS